MPCLEVLTDLKSTLPRPRARCEPRSRIGQSRRRGQPQEAGKNSRGGGTGRSAGPGKREEPLATNARLYPANSGSSLVLARTSRTSYVDRNQTYQLRDSELHALTEVGRFRVVATSDLAEFAYNGDSSPSNTFARGSHRLSLDIHTWRQLWTFIHTPVGVHKETL